MAGVTMVPLHALSQIKFLSKSSKDRKPCQESSLTHIPNEDYHDDDDNE
jgi:hypothetical protein